MKTGWLEIELRSELCTSTGGMTAGLIDIEVPHEHGLPFIPAKRLKGSLLEAGKELTDWGVLEQDDLNALFGAAGQAGSSVLQIYDAHLFKLPHEDGELVVDDYHRLLEQLERQQELSEQDVLEQFTSLHTRTAIDDMDGVAADGSLRTMRAINKGLTLRSRIELHATEEEECARLLKTLTLCAKALRSLGIANTRGSGEIRCKLSALESPISKYGAVMSEEAKSNQSVGSEWTELPFRLVLEQPVIVARGDGLDTGCTDWIPGSALLGAFASLYIRAFGLGERAHEEERFSRIFLRGGVEFGYAMPMQNNVVFAPCPALWQREKNENRVYDLAVGSAGEKVVLRNLNSMVYRDTASAMPTLWEYNVRKQLRMHHARAGNRAIGRALGQEQIALVRDNGALMHNEDEPGQLYQYESLMAGQQFCGTLRGRREDLRLLQDLASRYGNRIRLGRSRTAEYGNVFFYYGEEELRAPLVPCPEEQENDRFMIALVTPMLLLDETGRPDPDPRWLIGEIQKQLHCRIASQVVRLRYTTLSGYNAQWRLPKPQRAALDAGSALVITTDRPIAVRELEALYWGANTGEGCGQIKAIPLPSGKEGDSAQVLTLKTAERRPTADEKHLKAPHPLLKILIARRDETRRQREQRIEGAQEAQKMAKARGGISKTRIRQLLEWAERSHYAEPIEQVDSIADDAIRAACRELLKPCEDKDSHFIRGYLRALELQARKEKE